MQKTLFSFVPCAKLCMPRAERGLEGGFFLSRHHELIANCKLHYELDCVFICRNSKWQTGRDGTKRDGALPSVGGEEERYGDRKTKIDNNAKYTSG